MAIEITDAEVDAALDSWYAAALAGAHDQLRDEVKANARERMRVALVAAAEAEQTEHETCAAEMHSWAYFRPGSVDSYWMRCDRLGPHDEHKNSQTGAHWKDVA